MRKLGLKDARHLLTRSGIGLSWQTLTRYSNLSRADSIPHIIHSASNKWALRAPALASRTHWKSQQSVAQRQRFHKQLNQEKMLLRSWVVQNLLETPYPLTERMVLFWHNHFTSSLNKVNQPSLLLKQNRLFRYHSLGNFKQLLFAVARDPAMLLYLDNDSSMAGKPNENFARELLELFTLGEGNFSEADVQGAARAFTGWTVNHQNGEFLYRGDLHDAGTKYFLGQKGQFSGDQILEIVLKNTHTAEHIAKQFWLEFISDETPDQPILQRWGKTLLNANYDIKTFLIMILSSAEFWSAHNNKIKSPVELVVGTLRSLRVSPFTTERIVGTCDALGQKILTPETPQGYVGGQNWIDTYTLPKRISLMSELIDKSSNRDIASLPMLSAKEKTDWLLAGSLINKMPQGIMDSRQQLRSLLTDTAYQLT